MRLQPNLTTEQKVKMRGVFLTSKNKNLYGLKPMPSTSDIAKIQTMFFFKAIKHPDAPHKLYFYLILSLRSHNVLILMWTESFAGQDFRLVHS